MEKGICYIVGAGECDVLDFQPVPADYVIAADGGLRYLEQNKITADFIIGDFDSLQYTPASSDVLQLPEQKDETDLFAAIRHGIGLGYTEFRIYGGTGGRIDHTLANIQILLYLADRQLKGFLYARDSVLTVIRDSSLNFDSACTGYVAVFSISDKSTGVSLKHLKYELTDAELTNSFPLGVSNEFIGEPGRISVKDGALLVVFPR